ncbi:MULTISPECIES: pilin major subunit VirB2 [unclassified Rhizobium]|uniref:pilin major subunit VirB2 n=1 Tax=unclassified Rhizobium TaxID=2613769 RepID=UPI00177A7F4F|nr:MULTISPECIES: pilin major subunit VirB2 [unclassified Rhizobium]MBD8689860.1 pilin major subunit VirB2 [Rhizobium sp. CFBP 13644]MBD8694449.1 pilin major subunit VirB2 [Rhizobium sp. CFBP 13717]
MSKFVAVSGAEVKPKGGPRRIKALTMVLTALWMGASTRTASAQGADPAAMLNNICDFILGPFGQSLAVLGIVAIGLSWMFGRASLGLVAGVVGGIVIMFGASFLGQTLTGG